MFRDALDNERLGRRVREVFTDGVDDTSPVVLRMLAGEIAAANPRWRGAVAILRAVASALEEEARHVSVD